MNDVTILYQGGSGGFLLFYYLLLSGKYQTGLRYDNIDDLIDAQFPASLSSSPSSWKHNELWPENLGFKNTKTTKNKLFLICNPCINTDMNLYISEDTYKILLYTDIRTQVRMAYEKQEYWFTKSFKGKFNAPASDQQYIKEIYKSSTDGLDPKVDRIKNIFSPDQSIRLQDFLQSKTINGFDLPNEQQLMFVDRWSSLQPHKVKRLL